MKKFILFLIGFTLLFSLVACSSKATVTFDPDNGEPIQSIEVIVGNSVVFPTTPEKEGYNFLGWFLDSVKFTETSKVNKNITLIAKWEKLLKEFTISYDAGEGANMSADVPTKFKENEGSLVKLPKPTKSGYVFLGWFDKDDNLVEVLENKNYELFAKWDLAETFEIIFRNDNKVYATVAAVEGTSIDTQDIPQNPEKVDYVFEGWYLGDTKYDFNTVITGDLELVAKWRQDKKIVPYSVQTPENIVLYNTNKGDQNGDKDNIDDHNEFAIWDLSYLVGDDNNWIFKPSVTFYKFKLDESGNLLQSDYEKNIKVDVWQYVIKIYQFNETTQQYDILVDNNDSSIIDSIDYEKCTINFADATNVSRNYQVIVYPTGLVQGQINNLERYSIKLNIEVVDGYNVYDAKELAYANNRTDEFKQAWEDFKVENGLQLNYVPASLILQANINITKNDFPSEFLWSAEEAKGQPDESRIYQVKDANNNVVEEIEVKLEGSLKDYGYIYLRSLQANETFTISGNYFKMDVSNLPLVVREDKGGNEITALGEVIAHATLFKMDGEDKNSLFIVENTTFVGNANRTELALKGGGIILTKTKYTSAIFRNNVSSCFFITYHLEKSLKEIIIEDCKAYDGFNSFIYNWGANNVQLRRSEMIGCGGPIIIQDHVNSTEDYGGEIGQITITDCNLQAYVTGNEGWFVLVKASALVPQIKALDALFNNPYFNRSFLKTQTQEGNKQVSYMNLICVNKSGSAQSITAEKIKGSTTIVNSETELNYSFNFGLNNPYLAGMLDATFGQTATFETTAGGFGYATATGILDYTNTQIVNPQNEIYSGEYLTIYYNGMAIVIEYFTSGQTLV